MNGSSISLKIDKNLVIDSDNFDASESKMLAAKLYVVSKNEEWAYEHYKFLLDKCESIVVLM